MNSSFPGLGLLAAALAISTLQSSATITTTTVAFTTLDSSGSYSATGGTGITGSAFVGGYQGYGNAFAPTVSGQLDSIGIALSYINQPELVNVQLRLDNGIGFPTGPILASGTVTSTGPLGSSSTALSIFTPSSSVLLTAGTQYWLLITPFSNGSDDVWNDATSGVIGEISGTRNGTTWGIGPSQPLSAFQVLVAAPEPSTLALALGGFLLIAARRHHHVK